MPSRKGMEQAMTWLQSKMAEGNTLDAINAEVCYNVIIDLQKKRKVIGALYHNTHTANRQLREELEAAKWDQVTSDDWTDYYEEEMLMEAGG